MAERQTGEIHQSGLSRLPTWTPLPQPPREAPLEEGPHQHLPAGARDWLLSNPALPALILQGK